MEWLEMNIAGALDGDTDAAMVVVSYAADFLSRREPLPDCLSDYLAGAFKSITNGKRADVAFNLTAPRGRNKHKNVQRNHEIASNVRDAIRQGQTLEAACGTVGNRHSLSESLVKKIYLDLRELLDTEESIRREQDIQFH